MDNPRIVIFSGGRLGPWALEAVQPDDVLIGADGGALFLIDNGLRPDTALGDFDSVSPGQLREIRLRSGETLDCDPVDKDYTDTELAFRLALTKRPASVLLLGVLGTRFDHSLANVHLLRTAARNGVEAMIVDEHNRIRLAAKELTLPASGFPYVSLLPLTPSVTGITLEGFRYPLREATLEIGQSLGISNVLEAETGIVRIRDGELLVIESRD
nr:thiamine diphosphokinase [Paenibacillus humicola]